MNGEYNGERVTAPILESPFIRLSKTRAKTRMKRKQKARHQARREGKECI